jgi:hypothetical protein
LYGPFFFNRDWAIPMTHFIAVLAVLVAGACTTAMNWRFSYQLGTTEWDSCIWAIFSVALDVTKWLMLPYAASASRSHKPRACAAFIIWLVATTYSFTAAIGFAAFNRDNTTSERARQAQLRSALETMRLSPRWQSSAACADATALLSKQFCETYRATEARLKISPQDSDPQAILLAKLTGLSIEAVRLALSIFLAVACEVISALGFFAIMQEKPKQHAPSSQTPAAWKRPEWPDMPRRDTSWRDASRPVATSQK